MSFVAVAPVRPSTSRFTMESRARPAAKFSVRAEAEEKTEEPAPAPQSSKPSWEIPAEMRDFDAFMAGRQRRPRTGVTIDQENGLMNTWAVEPKMYVEENRGGLFGGLMKALGLKKDEEEKK